MVLAILILTVLILIAVRFGDDEAPLLFLFGLLPAFIFWLIGAAVLNALPTDEKVNTYRTSIESWQPYGDGFVLNTPNGPIVVEETSNLDFEVSPADGPSTYFKYCEKPHPFMGFDIFSVCIAEVNLNSKDIDK